MARYLQYLSLRPAAAPPQRRPRRPRPVPFSGLVVLVGSLGNAGLAVTALGHQLTTFICENKVAVVGRIDEGWNKKHLAILAWSALMASILVLALLPAGSRGNCPGRRPGDCQSPAGAALADGDDVSAPFVADLCGGAIGVTPMSCSVPATGGKACIS
jgi:hypothetical protein